MLGNGFLGDRVIGGDSFINVNIAVFLTNANFSNVCLTCQLSTHDELLNRICIISVELGRTLKTLKRCHSELIVNAASLANETPRPITT